MGFVEYVPDHLKNGRTAEAIMAPGAIVAAGAGASIGILAGTPLLGVIGLAALAYLIVAGAKLPHHARTHDGQRIDPRTLKEPWSRFVSGALRSLHQFEDIVRSVRPGPVHDRLVEIGAHVDDAVHECWRVARRGNALATGVRTLRLDGVRSKLATVRAEQPSDAPNAAALEATAMSLQAQLDSGERLARVATDARAQLQLLDARLDEAVARAVELSLQAADIAELNGLDDDIESLVADLESLRQGLEEAARATALGSGGST